MKPAFKFILIINNGSSSIKFAVYEIRKPLTKVLCGELEYIGLKNTKLTFTDFITSQKRNIKVNAADHKSAALFLTGWLEQFEYFDSIKAIGHRIVHGMEYTEPAVITSGLLNRLKKICGYDPEHLPAEIKLIEMFRKQYPGLKQIACFDTSFHASMPLTAKLLAIPRRYYNRGIHRYGFHGLSYSFLLEELSRTDGIKTSKGKIILAHLGSGASMAAVNNGKSIDCSMGFTPASGMPMSTRSGDLDPGAAWYLMKHEKLSPKKFSHLINYESGLLGISGTSPDMRVLIKHAKKDSNASEAVDYFCYQAKKWIGSFAAALGGLDTLVFTGGIGENSSQVRSKICDDLGFLGIYLDKKLNTKNETIISSKKSIVKVRVIKTNEELMIARNVLDFLKSSIKK